MNDSATATNALNRTRRRNNKPANNHANSPSAADNTTLKFIDDIRQQIETLPGSYRFLYTEPSSLNSHFYFVGLNPGGTASDPSDVYVESGNAFLNENWHTNGSKNDLQKQVLYFMEDMARHVGNTEDWMPYMNTEWLISNYVFYRSHTWAEMAAKKAHVNLCKQIWKQIFQRKIPKIIVANGHDTFDFMIALLREFGWTVSEEVQKCPAWNGPRTCTMKKGTDRCFVVGFAHLSRFRIIRRPQNRECLQGLYAKMKEFL